MADAKKAEAVEEAEAAPAPKKKKLLLFIIIGVVVLVLGGGGAAYFMMKKSSHPDEEAVDGEEAPAKEQKARKKSGDKEAPPVFVKLDPFTVKLQSEGSESYLQTTPELRVIEAQTGEKIKQYMPELRHRVLLILSAKTAADISNPQGVQQLSNEIRIAINRIIDGPKDYGKGKKKAGSEFPDEADPDDSVQSVLFTSFIVQ